MEPIWPPSFLYKQHKMGIDSEGDMFVHSALHTVLRLSCRAGPRRSTHGPDRGRVQECRWWADHTACALVSRRVLDLFLRAGRSRPSAGETIAAMQQSCGTQTREISLNPGRNVDLDQDAHSERQLNVYPLLERQRKKAVLCSIACAPNEHMGQFGLFYSNKLKPFL